MSWPGSSLNIRYVCCRHIVRDAQFFRIFHVWIGYERKSIRLGRFKINIEP
jgi:hypothetical protein